MSSSDHSSSDKDSSRRSSRRGFRKLRPTADDRGVVLSSSVPAPTAPVIEQFRGGASKRLHTHPLERALLWTISAHIVFLPWALGTMRPWAQWISLGFSALSFLLSLLPRTYTSDHTGGAGMRLFPTPKLLRFPLFWLGLALLGLIVVQGLNPAWEYQSDGRVWWMRRTQFIEWLPSGVRVPFAMWGPWRMLMIYASAWLTVCALWVGVTRRRTLQRLFIVIAANGLIVALLGLAQRLGRADKIFWFVDSANPAFFASFVYKNHAGGYLNVVLAVACGLGSWFYLRGVRRMEKSNPSGVFAFVVTCIAVGILVSYARGATLTMLAYLTVIVIAFVYHQFRLPAAARTPVVAVALLLVFGFFLKTGMDALHSDLAWDRLKQAISGNDLSVQSREIANKASADMLRDHWGTGVGSGSFRFLFTPYQHKFPTIVSNGRPMYWEHAHNDVLEIPIELGLPGVLLILAGFGFWALRLIKAYAWQNPLSASVVLGCLSLVGMSWGDFVFFCPAILITWCVLWPAATLWAEFEERAR